MRSQSERICSSSTVGIRKARTYAILCDFRFTIRPALQCSSALKQPLGAVVDAGNTFLPMVEAEFGNRVGNSAKIGETSYSRMLWEVVGGHGPPARAFIAENSRDGGRSGPS